MCGGEVKVKVKADSLLAMLPTANKGKHIDRQLDGRRDVCRNRHKD